VVVLDDAGKRVGARRFPHSPEGLNELKQFVLSIAMSPDNLAWIVETSHGLLINFLLSAGFPVYPVNPKMAQKLRKVAGAKTDQIDASVLAKLGRFDLDELRRLEPDSPTVQELKLLTRDQDALILTQTRLVNQLIARLKDYDPVALHLFTKLRQRSTLLFLQAHPSLQAVRAASLEEIKATLHAGKHTSPTKVASKIFEEVHRPQLETSEIIVRAKSRLMLALVKQLLVVIEEIAHYDEEIEALFLTHEDHELWRSFPRVGKRLAPRRLSEWGDDRHRYADAKSVQTLAGTAPVPFQSGKYAKAHQRFACVKPLRDDLQQFAWQSTLSEPWAASYYQRKLAEGKTRSMAVRALANVWVRIIYRVWQNKTSYQAEVFEAAQQAHAKRVA